MNTNLIIQNDKPADELIVIPDECGDSLWDAVLEQEVKPSDVKTVSKNAASLLNSIDAVQLRPSSTGRSQTTEVQ